MRRSSTLTVSALALTVTLTLVGCAAGTSSSDSSSSSSSAPSQASTLDAAPATGPTIEGDGYSYAVPEGWEQQDSAIAAGADTIALDMASTGDFATNVNVVLSPAGLLTADEVESFAGDELEAGGATDVEILDRVIVGGSESAHVTAALIASDVAYRIHQYYASSATQTYVITFSFSEDVVSDDDALAIAESVLASWVWL